MIDVVIPTWNGARVLARCLSALIEEDANHNAIVVDNGSSDGTPEMIQRQFPSVKLVRLSENLGFGRAVNQGIAAGTADTVVLLNNDAVVRKGFLDGIATPLGNEGIGMVAGVLLVDGTDIIDSAGVEIDRGLAHFAFMSGCPLAQLGEHSTALLGPSGGAAAFRRSVLEDVDGFDEELFAYCEDVDLALRIRAAGWTCALAPEACADHLGSSTLGLRTVRQVAISSWSRGYMLGRWRVGMTWIATELWVGLLDCFVLRSLVPLTGRFRGLRHGRHLPARVADRTATARAMGWLSSMRRRFELVREYERRRAR